MEQQTASGTMPQEELGGEQNSPNVSWGWQLALGTILTIMGFAALSTPVLISVSSALILGWFLLFAGIAQMIIAFVNRAEESVAMNAMIGVMYFIFGIILANGTLFGNLISITLFLAIFFLIDGIFKLVLSLQMRGERNWGWLLAGSIVSMLFSILIFANIYASSIILIGLLIGIQLIFMGIGMLFEGFAERERLSLESGDSAKKSPLLLIAIIALLAFAFIRFF